jgi:hypothetical protein
MIMRGMSMKRMRDCRGRITRGRVEMRGEAKEAVSE